MSELSREKVEALLIAVARAAHTAMDDSEELPNGVVVLDEASALELTKALDALDELPDQPGCAGTGPANAEYALRALPPAQAEPVAWRQKIGGKWAYFDGPLDPREVHDNGKPCEPLGVLPLPAQPVSEQAQCDPTQTECSRCKNDIGKCDDVFGPKTAPHATAPAQPVSEERLSDDRIHRIAHQCDLDILNRPFNRTPIEIIKDAIHQALRESALSPVRQQEQKKCEKCASPLVQVPQSCAYPEACGHLPALSQAMKPAGWFVNVNDLNGEEPHYQQVSKEHEGTEGTVQLFALSPTPQDMVMVPVDALKWLMGCGDSFERPDGVKGNYWWRSEFRRLAGISAETVNAWTAHPSAEKGDAK